MTILLCLASAIFISTKDLLSKKLSRVLSSTASTFGSFAFAMPFYLIILLLLWFLGYEDFKVTPAFYWLVLARGVSDSFAEWFRMESFRHGEISFLIPYLSLPILFVALLAPFITGDTIGWIGISGMFLIFIGCVALGTELRVNGNYSKEKITSICFAILSSFFQALNTCIDKLASHSASPTFSAFAVTLFVALIFLPKVLTVKTILPSLKLSYKDSIFRGFAETGCMITKYTALLYLPTQVVAGLLRTSIIFTIIGSKTFLKEGEFKKRLLVGLIVFFGIILLLVDLY